MNVNRPQLFASLDPLPDDFAQPLRNVDARLSMLAQQTPVPMGLSNRIIEASLAAKRSTLVHSNGTPTLRLVGTEYASATKVARPLHRQTWARLAMAASVGIACALGISLLQSPAPTHSTTPVAINDRDVHVHDHVIASALESPHFSASEYEDQLGYLSDTMLLTYNDFTRF